MTTRNNAVSEKMEHHYYLLRACVKMICRMYGGSVNLVAARFPFQVLQTALPLNNLQSLPDKSKNSDCQP